MSKLATQSNRQKLVKSKPSYSTQPNHAVHFYAADEVLLNSLVEYFGTGLERGYTCIAITTPEHSIGLNAALRTNHIDILTAINEGQYLMFDAGDILDTFTPGGRLDYRHFLASIGRMVSLASGRGKPIRVFGEMVSLLWEKNNQRGAIQLEKYWHDFIDDHSLSLYCAYPKALFNGSQAHQGALAKICDWHSLVIGLNTPE